MKMKKKNKKQQWQWRQNRKTKTTTGGTTFYANENDLWIGLFISNVRVRRLSCISAKELIEMQYFILNLIVK